MTFPGLWMLEFHPTDFFLPCHSYLVMGSCSFLLCQEDKNTTEKSKYVTVELHCGRTAVGTFMFIPRLKLIGVVMFCVEFFGGVALS